MHRPPNGGPAGIAPNGESWATRTGFEIELRIIETDFTANEAWPNWPWPGKSAGPGIPIDIGITHPPFRKIGEEEKISETISRRRCSPTGNLYTVFLELTWRGRPDGGTARGGGAAGTAARLAIQRATQKDAAPESTIDEIHLWRNRETLYGRQKVVQATTALHGWIRGACEAETRDLTIVTHPRYERETAWSNSIPCSRKWTERAGREKSGPQLVLAGGRGHGERVEMGPAAETAAGTGVPDHDAAAHSKTNAGIVAAGRVTRRGAVRYFSTAHAAGPELRLAGDGTREPPIGYIPQGYSGEGRPAEPGGTS